jgi:hypothetical protein
LPLERHGASNGGRSSETRIIWKLKCLDVEVGDLKVDDLVKEMRWHLGLAKHRQNEAHMALMDGAMDVFERMIRILPEEEISLEQLAAFDDVRARINLFLGPMPEDPADVDAGNEANLNSEIRN